MNAAAHPNAGRLFLESQLGPENAAITIAGWRLPVLNGATVAPGALSSENVKTGQLTTA